MPGLRRISAQTSSPHFSTSTAEWSWSSTPTGTASTTMDSPQSKPVTDFPAHQSSPPKELVELSPWIDKRADVSYTWPRHFGLTDCSIGRCSCHPQLDPDEAVLSRLETRLRNVHNPTARSTTRTPPRTITIGSCRSCGNRRSTMGWQFARPVCSQTEFRPSSFATSTP